MGGRAERNRIRHNELIQSGVRNTFDRCAREHRVRDVGNDGKSAALFEGACSIAERASRVDNIVRDDAGAAGNIADDGLIGE